MRLEVEINEKALKDQMAKELAEQLLEKHHAGHFFGGGTERDVGEIIKRTLNKVLKENPKIKDRLSKKLLAKVNSDKLITQVAKEKITENLEDKDY